MFILHIIHREVANVKSENDEYFVKYVVEECYKAGARKVTIDWVSDISDKLAYKYQNVESLAEFPVWKEEKFKYQVEKLPARIFIDSSDPILEDLASRYYDLVTTSNTYSGYTKSVSLIPLLLVV